MKHNTMTKANYNLISILPVHGGSGIEICPQPLRDDHASMKRKLLAYLETQITDLHLETGLQPQSIVLIDYECDFPGRLGKNIHDMRCFTPYYAEVTSDDAWVIHHTKMAKRMQIARSTGLLCMGPNESIAVVFESSGQSSDRLVAAFLTDEHNRPRTIHGIYAHSPEITGGNRFLKSLCVDATETAITKATMDLMIEQTRPAFSDRRIQLLRTTIEMLTEHLKVAHPERKPSGALVKRWFCEGGTGAIAHLTKAQDGWARYPTSQDAWYFGIFINFAKREVMSYTEGDVTHVICLDDAPLWAELKEMAELFGADRQPCAKGYGLDGTCQHFHDTLFFRQGLRQLTLSQKSEFVFVGIDHNHTAFRTRPDSMEVVVPVDAYEVDLLTPMAFQPHQLWVQHADNAMTIVLHVGEKRFTGTLEPAQTN